MRLPKVVVDESSAGLRLDQFLKSHPEIKSRTKAAQLIEAGLVKKDGRPLKASYRLGVNDVLEIEIPEPAPSELQPFDLPIEIVYQDSDIAVVNKPAGLVVHPAAGHAQDTLVNVLIGRIDQLAMGFGEHRPGIVHRLDKDTSGLLVIAKNNESQEHLSAQFKEKNVHRIYQALVYGRAKATGRIETFLARHPVHRKKFSSQSAGKKAVTHFRLLKFEKGLSLLECRLETGRTHQIRVHLSESGHPVLSDPIYAGPRWNKKLGSELATLAESLNRIGLHARELGFTHPRTGERLQFTADWPRDMSAVLQVFNA